MEWDAQLYVLCLLDAFHDGGAGQELMEAALPAGGSAGLWVTDPNPRAQAFYAKRGFEPDGVAKVDDGVSEVRMVRRPSLRPKRIDVMDGQDNRSRYCGRAFMA
ncbi:GNAT family N-acetyltransferase [Oerskovia sp. M15]